MTTAVWVILCVLGLATGFAVGWSRRQRRTAAPVETPPAADPDTGPDAPVIDLRVLAGQAQPPQRVGTAAAQTPTTEAGSGDDGSPSGPATSSMPRLSLATDANTDRRTETATGTSTGTAGRPEAEVIDLVAATRQVPLHNLQFIEGIGPRLDKRLRANGIVTVTDLAAARRKELRRILAAHLPHGDADVDRMRTDARELVEGAGRGRVAPVDPGRELRQVQGIGTTMMRWLETRGITSLADLAELSKADIARLEDELTDYPGRPTQQKWRRQARRLLA